MDGPIDGFVAPVHRALTEPILLGGAPRAIAILNGTLAAALGLGLRLWLAGLLLWLVGHGRRLGAPSATAVRRRRAPAPAYPRPSQRVRSSMMNLAEYRRSTASLADFLPWAALVDEGIVLNKDGSFQRTARFRGPDLDSAVPAELVAVAGRLNNALRRLGSGWAIFVEAQRIQRTLIRRQFPDAASALVDAERRAQFEEAGAHYESAYFLTFLYLPPAEDTARAERLLYEGRKRGAGCRRARACAASSTGPTACCNSSKASCRSAAGSTTARR